jgi:hypothetical protein
MEVVGIFYGHLVHFTVFCYILWTFGIVRSNLVYFSPFWYFETKKNLATLGQSLGSYNFDALNLSFGELPRALAKNQEHLILITNHNNCGPILLCLCNKT